MKKRKKEINNLYVDGSNVYGAQWELFGPGKYLDFGSLINIIEKTYELKKVYFYASYSPVPKKYLKKKPPNYILNERLFYRSALKHPKVIFYRGHRSKTSGKEKGVDIHLGCDIVEHVVVGLTDRVILMSGDADLIYPLEIAKRYKKHFSVITMPNRLLLGVSWLAKDYHVLKISPKFFQKQLPRNLLPKVKIISCGKEVIASV